jgi:hypothetical protein
VFLKIVPKTGNEMYIFADFFCIQEGVNTGENQPIAGKEARTEFLMRLPEQSSKLVRFFHIQKKAKSFYVFSLHQGSLKSKKITIGS